MIRLGPQDGRLTVLTGKGGAIAKAGHNLVLEVTRWQATLAADALELTADARSLRVRSGSGGLSPLGDEEKAGIAQTIDEEVLQGGSIVFRSSRVSPRADGLDVEGELELLGVRHGLRFALDLDAEHLTGSATLKQTDFGLKPYSALFGTLKVADELEVAIDAPSRGAPPMVELEHAFTTGKPAEYNLAAVLDLDRIIPCVEGGKVTERVDPEKAKAEIKVKMGAMSMTFKGTVEVAERDDAARRAVLRVKSKDTGGSGYANADVAFSLADGGGTIHTRATVSGKAASMGEGVVSSVLDALIADFTTKLAAI